MYCASSETIDPAFDRLADRVGAELAARGHDLVSGGGRVSMMGALAQAARAGGAHTLGVIPEALLGWEVADTEADELVVTPDMRTRKARMDDAADAFLALPGGLGTLEELFEVWVAGTLGMHSKPVVVLDPTGVYAPLRELVDGLRTQGFVRAPAADLVIWTTDAGAAFDRIEAALADRTAGPPGGGPTPGELLEAEA